MIPSIAKKLLPLAATIFLVACVTTNSVTGRSQFIMIPPSQDAALGLEAMNEVKKTAPVVTDSAMAERIRRMGHRIAAISDKPDMDWEFVLIDEPVLNAWALPGGKVAIYAKMAESFPSDDELAAVMGHEIAHAVLRHGAEQMSRAQMQNLLIVGAGVAVGATTEDAETTQMAVGLAALAAQGFVQLPHSRNMELEADHVGAIYMAKAGYDPRGAVRLWEGMKSMKEGNQPPTFLSTHPSDDNRIERLRNRMDEYLSHYQR